MTRSRTFAWFALTLLAALPLAPAGCRSEAPLTPTAPTSTGPTAKATPVRAGGKPAPLVLPPVDAQTLARAVLDGSQLAWSSSTRTVTRLDCRQQEPGAERCELQFTAADGNRPETLPGWSPGEDTQGRKAALLEPLAARLRAGQAVGLLRFPWNEGSECNISGVFKVRWQQKRLEVVRPDGGVVSSWDLQSEPGQTLRPSAVFAAGGVPTVVVTVERQPDGGSGGSTVATTELVVLPVTGNLVDRPLIP